MIIMNPFILFLVDLVEKVQILQFQLFKCEYLMVRTRPDTAKVNIKLKSERMQTHSYKKMKK